MVNCAKWQLFPLSKMVNISKNWEGILPFDLNSYSCSVLCIGHLFHLFFVSEIDFVLRTWNIQFFKEHFRKYLEYPNILGKTPKFWIFQYQSTKSISLTKIKWKRCPIHRNWLKIAHSGEFLVVPKIFGKVPKISEFGNSKFKINFCELNWVG